MATKSNISLFTGETYEIKRTVYDVNEDIFPLTDYTAELMVKNNLTDSDASAVLTKAGTISAPLTGVIVFSLDTDDTTLDAKTYYFDIKISGTKTKIVNYGAFIVNQAVNR